MKIKLLFLVTLLALGVSVFAQEGTPTKTILGFGSPSGPVAFVLGTHYIDQSTSPATLYVCSAVSIAAGPTPPSGTQTCTWTAVGGTVSSLVPTIQGGLYTLRSTLTKIGKMATASPAQLRVLVWGDSVAGFHNNAVAAGLRDSFGNAGVDISCQGTIATGQAGSCVTNDALSGGAFQIDGSVHAYDYTRSPTGVYYSLPAGACVLFGVGGGYMTANQLSLLYVSEPGAGSLQFQTNKNGAGFVTQSTTSAANATTIGSVVSVTMPDTGPYKIQACATGGTVNVFGPTFENSTINGVVIIPVSRGGLALNNANSTPTAVTVPWFTALAPDLILFEMKTNGVNNANCLFTSDSSTWLSNLTTFALNWTTANPLVDFIFFGSSPVISPNDACQITWNIGTRQVAQVNNAVYFDGYYPNLNYATEKALGWITDVGSPHQTSLGQAAESNLLWQQLGFNDFINGAGSRLGGITASSSVLSTLRINRDTPPLALGDAGTITTDPSNGIDLQVRPTRSIQCKDSSNNAYCYLASTNTAFAQATNFLPPFATSNGGETIKGPWIQALDANTVGILAAYGSATLKNVSLGTLNAIAYMTATNCQLGGATGTISPATCGSAAAGMIAIPASQTTYTVNTSAVTANSEIRVTQVSDNSGLPSSPTCSATPSAPLQSARVAGTSFTFTLTSVAAVTCYHYEIKN